MKRDKRDFIDFPCEHNWIESSLILLVCVRHHSIVKAPLCLMLIYYFREGPNCVILSYDVN